MMVIIMLLMLMMTMILMVHCDDKYDNDVDDNNNNNDANVDDDNEANAIMLVFQGVIHPRSVKEIPLQITAECLEEVQTMAYFMIFGSSEQPLVSYAQQILSCEEICKIRR